MRAGGTLTVIWRADGLPTVLEALATKFGSVAILPVHGKDGGAAIRVIVQAVKGGRAPLANSLAPLVLNGKDNRPTAEAETVMRELAPLALGAAREPRAAAPLDEEIRVDGDRQHQQQQHIRLHGSLPLPSLHANADPCEDRASRGR